MKSMILALSILATTAANAIAQTSPQQPMVQFYEPGQPYTIDGITIPSQQTLSPASAPFLAFRPACIQLTAVDEGNPGMTTYGLPDPAGTGFIKLNTEVPADLSLNKAHVYLNAEGNCKLGGVEVPILYRDHLPQPLTPELSAQTTLDPSTTTATTTITNGPPMGLWIGLVFLVGGAGVIGWTAIKSQRKGVQQGGQSVQVNGTTSHPESPLTNLMSMLEDDNANP